MEHDSCFDRFTFFLNTRHLYLQQFACLYCSSSYTNDYHIRTFKTTLENFFVCTFYTFCIISPFSTNALILDKYTCGRRTYRFHRTKHVISRHKQPMTPEAPAAIPKIGSERDRIDSTWKQIL